VYQFRHIRAEAHPSQASLGRCRRAGRGLRAALAAAAATRDPGRRRRCRLGRRAPAAAVALLPVLALAVRRVHSAARCRDRYRHDADDQRDGDEPLRLPRHRCLLTRACHSVHLTVAGARLFPAPRRTVRAATVSHLRRFALVLAALLGSLALLVSAGAGAATPSGAAADPTVEVVVTLPRPPLARAILADRALAAATTSHRRLNVRAVASVSYLRTLAAAQRTLAGRIHTAIPQSSVRWHYGVVLDGMAVSLPRSQL